MSSTTDFNLIFDALDRADDRWRAASARKVYTVGEHLLEATAVADAVFMPTDGLVSLLIPSGTGEMPQVGMVGRWGAIGVETLLLRRPSTVLAVVDVQAAGMLVPMAKARAILETCERSRNILGRYLDHQRDEFARWAANASSLTIRQRTAAWIDEASTCLGSTALPVTQELIADRLGVRRPSITRDIGALDEAGAIKKGWGRIDIRDADALCEAAHGVPVITAGREAKLILQLDLAYR